MVNPVTPNITRLRPVTELEPDRGAARPTASGAAPAAPGKVGMDSLSLSAEAGSLPEALRQGPPIDRALVDRLAGAIAAGAYPIDPERIADVLFRDAIDLSR